MARLDNLAERITSEQRAKSAIKILAEKYDIATRKFIESVYDDQELRSAYNAIRASISLDKLTRKDRRLVIKYPNIIVYNFLNDVFTPRYGDDWATDKDKLKKVIAFEDLIKPWVVGEI